MDWNILWNKWDKKVLISLLNILLLIRRHYFDQRFSIFSVLKECKEGWYGANCSQQCERHCGDGATCNQVTGHCDRGCEAGWTGDMCDKGFTYILTSHYFFFAFINCVT